MNKLTTSVQPWKNLESREVFSDLPWVRLIVEKVELPGGRVIDNFYQLQMRDYALIIAKTPDDKVIMTRQYKHGIRQISLMFPGGAIEQGESPLEAARRELLEETGYAVDSMEFLGSFVQDANHYLCQGHFFLGSGARAVTAPQINDEEEVEIVPLGREEILAALQKGEVASVAVMSGLLLALNPSILRANK
jgi:ADP-ribose pyrophosphatase